MGSRLREALLGGKRMSVRGNDANERVGDLGLNSIEKSKSQLNWKSNFKIELSFPGTKISILLSKGNSIDQNRKSN